MGRKKSLHPSDILRKKQRRRELRKLQKQRQEARKQGLRRLAPEKLLAGIKKFNRLKNQEGGLDERTAVKRKNLVSAYNDVLKQRQEKEATRKKEKSVTISGINKILGVEEKIEETKAEVQEEKTKDTEKSKIDKEAKEADKENEAPQQIEDLEFPPGLPRPVHLCPPPGIRPRPQRQQIAKKPMAAEVDHLEDHMQKPDRNLTKAFLQPQVQIFRPEVGQKRRWKDKVPEDFFDPMNPQNPFFQKHPRQQAALTDEVKKLERRQRKMMKRNNHQNNLQNQQQQKRHKNTTYGPTPPQNAILGPLPPTQAEQDAILPLPEPGEENGKIEILLPDSMMGLRPTSISVKRDQPVRKRKYRQLELAPDVGTNKQQKKTKKGKQKRKPENATEYDAFLQEIEGLM